LKESGAMKYFKRFNECPAIESCNGGGKKV
jgi:hypothetical protein